MYPRYQNINLPGQDFIDLVQDLGVNNDGTGDAGREITEALAQIGTGDRTAFGWLRPGTYRIASTITIPANVVLWGSGATTVLQTTVGVSAIDFATGFLRSEIAYMRIDGVLGTPAPFGISLDESQKCFVHDLSVWDFQNGISLSSGVPFSGYNTVQRVEINRSTVRGIRALANCNATTMKDSRVFFTYNGTSNAIGVDISDVQALLLENVTFDGADICVRGRNATGLTSFSFDSCYFEPGTNPTTAVVGTMYDVNIENLSDGVETVYFRNNFESGNRGTMALPPEGFVEADGYSQAFYGARYGGQAAGKPNFCYNGALFYYNLPASLPNWASANAPTLAQDLVTFYSGNRSLSAIATAPNSQVSCGFVVRDVGVRWVQCGIRYKVGPGNTGFFFTGTCGANNRQYADAVPGTNLATDPWRTAYVQVPVDESNRNGNIAFTIDSVGGVGEILIDEAWCTDGRYVVASTQYGERVELLPAPITILARAGIIANEVFGPIDILTLPATLAAPLDDFSTAPLGVVGAVLRVRVTTGPATVIAASAVITAHHWVYVDIPAVGTAVAATVQRVCSVYDQQPIEDTIVVRATSITGGYNCANGDPTDYEVALVGWVMG